MRVACVGCAATTVVESRLVERAVVAGGKAKERVVDRLIGSNDLRYASMKAALLVSSQDNEQAKSLIKLIATNLIASDLIEGTRGIAPTQPVSRRSRAAIPCRSRSRRL